MIRILGIDPGLNHTGYGVIDKEGSKLSFVIAGTIHSKGTELADRLLSLHEGLFTVIQHHRPHEAAIEETFVNTNAKSSLLLGHARGTLMLTCALSSLPIASYASTLVKKSVVGVGRAEKHQIAHMVSRLLPGCTIEGHDATDALAVAICHSSHAVFRGIKATS